MYCEGRHETRFCKHYYVNIPNCRCEGTALADHSIDFYTDQRVIHVAVGDPGTPRFGVPSA